MIHRWIADLGFGSSELPVQDLVLNKRPSLDGRQSRERGVSPLLDSVAIWTHQSYLYISVLIVCVLESPLDTNESCSSRQRSRK